MLVKEMERYVLLAIAQCTIATTSFDPWMFKIGFNTFALVIKFINEDWVPYHVIVGLFEILNTYGTTLA
jgi:hypothetical protein